MASRKIRPLEDMKKLAEALSFALESKEIKLRQQDALNVLSQVLTGQKWHNVRAQLLRGDAEVQGDDLNPWTLPDSPELIAPEYRTVAPHQILVGKPALWPLALMQTALSSADQMVIVLDGPARDYPYADLLIARCALPHVPALIVPDAGALAYEQLAEVLRDAQRLGRSVALDLKVTDTLLCGLSSGQPLAAEFPSVLLYPYPDIPFMQQELDTGYGRWPHLAEHPLYPYPFQIQVNNINEDIWTRQASADHVSLSIQSRQALTFGLKKYLGIPLTQATVVAWLSGDPYAAGMMLALGWDDPRVLPLMARSLKMYLVGHPTPSAWTYNMDIYINAVLTM